MLLNLNNLISTLLLLGNWILFKRNKIHKRTKIFYYFYNYPNYPNEILQEIKKTPKKSFQLPIRKSHLEPRNTGSKLTLTKLLHYLSPGENYLSPRRNYCYYL